MKIKNKDMVRSEIFYLNLGVKNILIKGGHRKSKFLRCFFKQKRV